jgi:uncharacterized protein
MRSKWPSKRALFLGLGLLLFGANLSPWMQAYRMTHFSVGGARTSRPEGLSWGSKLLLVVTGVNIPRPENVATPASVGLSYRAFQVPSGEGRSNEVWEVPAKGMGKLAILFHGYAGKKSDLLEEAAEFHRWGYGVWMVDFTGSGGSTGNSTALGQREASEVAEVFRAAKAKVPDPKIILFAHSMGSAAILGALAKYPIEPSAIILECPFNDLLSTVKNRFTLMGYPSFPFAQLLVFWGGIQQGFNGFSLSPAKDAEKVKVPTLLMVGEKDDRATVPQVRSIYDSLQGPKKFVVVPGIGHRSYLTAVPGLWKKEVSGFLGTLR